MTPRTQQFALVLLRVVLYCSIDTEAADSWGIDRDINRLLNSDDVVSVNKKEVVYARYNSTANTTSYDNSTINWPLSADAPIAESTHFIDPTALETSSKGKHPVESANNPTCECTQLKMISLEPLNSFIVCTCGSGLFGLLSGAWMLLMCTRRKTRIDSSGHGREFALKCKIILGMHIHTAFCAFLFLGLHASSRGLIAFAQLDDCGYARVCSITLSLLNFCTSVFWIFVGLSNIMLILFLRVYQPGFISTAQHSPRSRLFRSYRSVVSISLLLHTIPWISAVALNPLQIVILRTATSECSAIAKSRRNLLEAVTAAAPVAFAVISIIIRTRKFHSRRLHVPMRARGPTDYSCRNEQGTVNTGQQLRPPTEFLCYGQTVIGIFIMPLVTVVQLLCSVSAAVSIVFWIASTSLEERPYLLKAHNVLLFGSIGIFYSCTVVALRGKLKVASSTSVNGRGHQDVENGAWLTGEEATLSGKNASEAKLSPRELLAIPHFTRIQFFDSVSESKTNIGGPDGHESKEIPQVRTVYEPVVS